MLRSEMLSKIPEEQHAKPQSLDGERPEAVTTFMCSLSVAQRGVQRLLIS
jgi:hypothetical protein